MLSLKSFIAASLLLHGALLFWWVSAPKPIAPPPKPSVMNFQFAKTAAVNKQEPVIAPQPPAAKAEPEPEVVKQSLTEKSEPVIENPEVKKVVKAVVKPPGKIKPPQVPLVENKIKAAKKINKAAPKKAPALLTKTAPAPQQNAQAAATQISPQQRSDYEQILASWLSRFKDYPKRAMRRRITGAGLLTVVITSNGSVSSSRLVRSSGNAELDAAIMAMIRKADPLPKIPVELGLSSYSFTVPVSFELN